MVFQSTIDNLKTIEVISISCVKIFFYKMKIVLPGLEYFHHNTKILF